MDLEVKLFRMQRSDQGTFGILIAPDFQCYTGELPWRENERNISCIPPGEYEVKIRISPKYGQVYHVKEVPSRTFILIHTGNWCGDRSKGYRSNVNGCILLGQKKGLLLKQLAVLNSRITIRRFMDAMALQPFKLTIYENFMGGFE